jgi:hypothetical protein
VTVIATAVTPLAGSETIAPGLTAKLELAAIGPVVLPILLVLRVSVIRVGVMGTKTLPAVTGFAGGITLDLAAIAATWPL